MEIRSPKKEELGPFYRLAMQHRSSTGPRTHKSARRVVYLAGFWFCAGLWNSRSAVAISAAAAEPVTETRAASTRGSSPGAAPCWGPLNSPRGETCTSRSSARVPVIQTLPRMVESQDHFETFRNLPKASTSRT